MTFSLSNSACVSLLSYRSFWAPARWRARGAPVIPGESSGGTQDAMAVRTWLIGVNQRMNSTHTHIEKAFCAAVNTWQVFVVKACLLCILPPTPLSAGVCVCVWESAHYSSHRSGALRLLIAHTNRLVIQRWAFIALFPVARGECLSPQVASANLASPVPRGRNRKLIRAPGCALILLWKVFQAASQYWFFWAEGK